MESSMPRSRFDDLPLGTLLCGSLLVIGCLLFGWWSAAHAADHAPLRIQLSVDGATPSGAAH